MNSETLVVLILIAVAALFIFWVRSKGQGRSEPDRVDDESMTPKTVTPSHVTLGTGGATRLPSKEGDNEPNLDADDRQGG
jgi:hypothetical protein